MSKPMLKRDEIDFPPWLCDDVHADRLCSRGHSRIRLLIIEGVSNHDWRHRLALVKDILARDGSFDVDVSITPSEIGDPAWASWRPDFSKYDVVLSGYNNLGGKARWPVEVQKSFEDSVRKGGGFYCYHEDVNQREVLRGRIERKPYPPKAVRAVSNASFVT